MITANLAGGLGSCQASRQHSLPGSRRGSDCEVPQVNSKILSVFVEQTLFIFVKA